MADKEVYDKERMYNSDQKEEYLETFDNEGTRRTVAYIFYASEEIESQLGYDLCNFSFNEIVNVLENMDSMNRSTARANGRFIKGYISWCIENGRRQNNIHPLKDVGVDWADDYVFAKKLYITDKKIAELDAELVAQDSVILYLLFEGVWGEGMSELTNLKYDDIDWNNNLLTLRETHKDGSQTIRDEFKVSDRCRALLERAYKQDTYTGAGSKRESNLVRNDYILRNVYTKKVDPSAPISKHGIYRRLSNISDHYRLPYLSANNVRKSGMIKMAADIITNGGELEREELYAIADRFGVNKVKNGDYEYHNVTILKDFINEDNISELYPEAYNN